MPFDLDWLLLAVMERGIELVIIIAKMVASYSPNGNLGLMPQATLILMSIGLVMLLFLSTQLRLCSVPILFAAAILMVRTKEPDIIVAEEGRLVALRTADNNLAINRPSGSAFTLNNWKQGYGTDDVVKPLEAGARLEETQFECADTLCTAREQGGLIVTYTDNPAQKLAACAEGDIVILAFASTEAVCNDESVLVINKRDLALRGTAKITLRASGPKQSRSTNGADKNGSAQQHFAEANAERVKRLRSAAITYAVGTPSRPWNAYRTHSRAARNLDEYQSRKRGKINAE